MALFAGEAVVATEFDAAAEGNKAGLTQSLMMQGGGSYPFSSLRSALTPAGFPRFDVQAGGGLGGPSLGAGGLGAGLPSQQTAGAPGLRIIPLIRMSERYDSNVFFAPNLPGLDRQDWVSAVSPQIFLQDNGPKVGTTLNLGATGEYFVKNPGLSYIGYNARGSLNVTPFLRRFVPEASLFFAGTYTYTPLSPAFLGGGGQSHLGVGEEITGQLPVADTYIRGIQSQRINSSSYSGTVAGSINYSPNLYFQGSYGYAVLKFGDQPSALQANGFRPIYSATTTHTVNVGPVYRLSPFDTVNLNYQYLRSEFGSSQNNFQVHQATIGYQRAVDASLVGRIFGGAATTTQESGGGAPSTTSNTGEQIAFTGGGSLTWSRRSTLARIAVSTGVYPNYIGVAGSLLSTNVSVQGAHRLDDNLGVYAQVGYANNSAIGGQAELSGVEFRSYNTSESLWYRFGPWFVASLTHEWGFFTGNYTGQGESTIIRNAVTISLTKAWY